MMPRKHWLGIANPNNVPKSALNVQLSLYKLLKFKKILLCDCMIQKLIDFPTYILMTSNKNDSIIVKATYIYAGLTD